MSDQELSGSADNQISENEGSQQSNQRPKGPTKIPGTAVFRAPYPQGKTGSPYYIISNTPNNAGVLQQMNASDEDKRRIMHNEVERRRKEKINKWIVRLCAIVPDCNSGKLSKNCVLEKTVNFLNQLMKERDLPDNVQTLRAEVMSLTEKVESLSTENAMYLNLLKEAQALSGGAWSLNMSIQSNKAEILSSSDDSSSTTMTPTLDRIEIAPTNVKIAPNLSTAAATSSSQHPIFATIPILQTAGGQSTILQTGGQSILTSGGQSILTSGGGQSLLGQTVQPVITQAVSMKGAVSSIPVVQSGTVGSMVTALPANQIFQQRPMANGNTPHAASQTLHMATGQAVMAGGQAVMAGGQAFLAQNGTPVLANGAPVQVAGVQPVLQLGQQTATSTGKGVKSSHSIQALLSTATSGGLTGGTGKTVYTIPAYPLQASNQGQGNIYIPTAQHNTPVLVQGEQGHVVIMTPGTNPYFAIPLNTMSSSHVMCEPTASFKSPIVWNQLPPTNQQQEPAKSVGNVLNINQSQPSNLVNIIPQSLAGQQPMIQVPVVQSQQPLVQQHIQQQPVAQVLNTQAVINQQPVVGVQQVQQLNQQSMVQLVNQGMLNTNQGMINTNQGMINTNSQILNQGGQVLGNGQEHTIIQVPNSEVLIPQSQTQCFIPALPVVQNQVRQSSVIATVAPVTSTTSKVTDFSVGTFLGAEAGEGGEEEYRDYLRTSDTSFSSECFTPPYTSANLLLSSAGRDSMSPGINEETETKPSLNHSIASLTGMN